MSESSPRLVMSVSSGSPLLRLAPHPTFLLTADSRLPYKSSPVICNRPLVVSQEDYSSLKAFLDGVSTTRSSVQIALGSIYRKAYPQNGKILVGKARLVPVHKLTLLLAPLPCLNLEDIWKRGPEVPATGMARPSLRHYDDHDTENALKTTMRLLLNLLREQI